MVDLCNKDAVRRFELALKWREIIDKILEVIICDFVKIG